MPIPITVITGFLGAGKTTLLQYILTAPHGKRILVIQNEFSDEMGIESPQLVDGELKVLTDVYELPNGCLCCSVRDSVIGTLEAVLSSQPGRFDYVLVETSGLADPESVVGLFWMDSDLGSELRLDSVIAVVDALNICKYMSLTQGQVEQIVAARSSLHRPPLTDDSNEYLVANIQAFQSSQHGAETATVRRHTPLSIATEDVESSVFQKPSPLALAAVKQIACANVILLNKIDLVTLPGASVEGQEAVHPLRGIPSYTGDAPAPVLEAIESVLQLLNPQAALFRCEKGRVPLDALLDRNAFAVNPSNVTSWFQHTVVSPRGVSLNSDVAGASQERSGHSHSSPQCHRRVCTSTRATSCEYICHSVPEDRFSVSSSLISFVTKFSLPAEVTVSSTLPSSTIATLLSAHPWTVPRASLWSDLEAHSIFGLLVWRYDDDSSGESNRYGDIFRYKGLFLVADEECNSNSRSVSTRLVSLQGVGEVFEIQPVVKSLSCVEKLLQVDGIQYNSAESCFEFRNKFLFVGLRLDINLISQQLNNGNRSQCIASNEL